MRLASSPARRLLAAAVGTLLALGSLSARADFQSDVTVRLIAPGGFTDGATTDPTPINVSQLVTAANLATGVQAGDGGAIGGTWMLAGEAITFVGNTIHVTSYAGAESASGLSTGYLGDGTLNGFARYEFDGLSIAGLTIVGATITASSGLASPAAADLLHYIDANTVSLDLSSIFFVNLGSGTANAHADFVIQILTRDGSGNPGGGNNLPEPATLALFAIAALGARAARRHA